MTPGNKSNLDIICAQIDKKYGKGTTTILTNDIIPDVNSVFRTGSIQLDLALGVGGYKKGRIIEIIGEESSGKTTLCLTAISNAQKENVNCIFIDMEQSLDPLYAKALGCNLDNLIISQPDYGEQALDIVDTFVRSGEIGLIIVDSVAALIPQSELQGSMGDSSIGVQARMMSQAMRKLAGPCSKADCSVIFTNQTREKIGVMFGSPATTPGGKALKFYASQRLKISRIGDIKSSNEEVIGHKTKVQIIKNKTAPPKRIAEFNIMFGKGIDVDSEVLDLAIGDGIIIKAGAWYKYNDENIAQGRTNAISWLNDNPEIKKQITNKVLEARGLE